MSVNLNEVEQAEVDVEEWLVEQAASGVPELVLVNRLRDNQTTSRALATSHGCGAAASSDVTIGRLAVFGLC